MPTSMIDPAFIRETLYAVHEEVMNRRDPVIADRQAYPWWSFLLNRKQEGTFTQGKCIVKGQRDGGLEVEHWDGKQVLSFQENRVDWEMEFIPRRTHIGIEFIHAQLEDQGYVINPNEERGEMFAKKISKADVDRMMNIFDQRIEDFMDAWDTRLDRTFLLDGTQDPLAPIGLDGLMPLDNTSGTIGGQLRTDPLFQHQVALNSTYGVGGTLERDLQGIIRRAEVNNRGTPSKIDFIQAGYGWIDRYIAFARANDMPYQRVAGDKAATRVDVGIPDSAIHFNNIPVVHNPSFESLDTMGLYTGTPWTRRAYLMASKTWRFRYAPGKLKRFSCPWDPPAQRLTRCSLEGRHCLVVTKPNGNGLSTIAS